MFSLKSIVLIAAAFMIGSEASGVAVPAALAAPLVAPAHVGYSHDIPQNVLPYASQVSVVNRAVGTPYAVAASFSAPVAAPVAAPFTAPLAAPFPAPAPFAAPFAARFAAAPYSAPYFAAPAGAPVLPAPYAEAYPYAAQNYFRAPFTAPAFVR